MKRRKEIFDVRGKKVSTKAVCRWRTTDNGELPALALATEAIVELLDRAPYTVTARILGELARRYTRVFRSR